MRMAKKNPKRTENNLENILTSYFVVGMYNILKCSKIAGFENVL